MEKNAAVEINQVGNGFVVTVPFNMINRGEFRNGPESTHVFESFAALVQWLGEHFSHRKTNLISDTDSAILVDKL